MFALPFQTFLLFEKNGLLVAPHLRLLQLHEFKEPNEQTWHVLDALSKQRTEIGVRVAWYGQNDFSVFDKIPNIRNMAIASFLSKDFTPFGQNKSLHTSALGKPSQSWWVLLFSGCRQNSKKELNEARGRAIRFGFVDISPNKVYWYATKAFADSPVGLYNEEILNFFGDYHPMAKEIVSCTQKVRIHAAQLAHLRPMEAWHKGNACLVGDAAHATTPNMGQVEKILDDYLGDLKKYCAENNPAQIEKSLQKAIEKVNAFNQATQMIETDEREELCPFFIQTIVATGIRLPEGFDPTLVYRDW